MKSQINVTINSKDIGKYFRYSMLNTLIIFVAQYKYYILMYRK
jgi:hypothetical protein